MNYYSYTDTEVKDILKSMVVLCDTREQRNEHITAEFDRLKVQHKPCKLSTGDYSVMLPAMPDYGIARSMRFDRAILVERKGSLEELSGNFTKERERLKDELCRAKDTKTYLLIEGASYGDILEHRYQTQLSEKAFFASLLSFQQQYGLNISFMDKKHSGTFIYSLFYYFIRNYIVGA